MREMMRRCVIQILGLLLVMSPVMKSGGEESPSVILFMIDGLRPDYVDYLIRHSDQLPNIRKYFYQEGAVVKNSFTTLSLTLPSWSETLSGVGIDRSSFKGNEVVNRETKVITNYLDWRKDILSEELRKHGRAYRRMRSNGHPLLIDYFRSGPTDAEGFLENNEEESDGFSTFFPLNDRFPRYLIPGQGDGPKGGSVLRSLLHLDLFERNGLRLTGIKLFYENSFFNLFDRAGIDHVLEEMTNPETPKKRFLGVYLAGADHYFHLEHHKGLDTLFQIDFAIGQVVRAAQRGKYRGSLLALVSDHGSQGGKEFATNLTHPLRGEEFDMTGVNLCNYFTGRMNDANFLNYQMNVTGSFATEGRFAKFGGSQGDFFRNLNLQELAMHSSQCTNVKRSSYADYGTCAQLHQTHPDEVHAAVTSSQLVYLAKGGFDSKVWNRVNNWHDLTHYRVGYDSEGRPVVRDLLEDLERIRVRNLRIYPGYKDGDPSLDHRYEQLRAKIGHQPLDWVVARVARASYQAHASAKLPTNTSDEDVLVIHKDRGNQALLLVQNQRQGEPRYRLRLIKNFSQDSRGRISFDDQTGIDPFGYWGNPLTKTSGISDEEWFRRSHTFREWTARYVETQYPTATGAIARLMLARGEGKRQDEAERPDLMLGPKYGFIFECGEDYSQAHHGMMQRESVHTTMMFSGPGIPPGRELESVQFNLDLIPTLLSKVYGHPGSPSSSWPLPAGAPTPRVLDGQPIRDLFNTREVEGRSP